MKVILITGSYPPDVCGTADYTARLGESLERAGLDVSIFYRKHWGLSHLNEMLREIDNRRPDLIHMQYPTTGYGAKLGPQGIAMLRPLVVTLHEASQSHPIRQMSLYPFLLRARGVIFTNQYEQKHVLRLAPWIRGKCSIIPIGCNLPLERSHLKRRDSVTCFSIIRPQKGLEDVIELARALQQHGSSIRVRVVGALMPRWSEYYALLKTQSSNLAIDWDIGMGDEALSRALAETSIAYLPFPDGASERRSSLIAMLVNRACVLTTDGDHLPEQMRACVLTVASPREAAIKVIELMSNPVAISQMADLAAEYAGQFSWEAIGQRHLAVYESCCRDSNGRIAHV